MNGSIFLTSFGATNFAGSNSRTSPAMRVGNVLASKCVIGPMPLVPATIARHAVGTSLPTGLTMPSPVITTRRLLISLPLQSSMIARVKKQPSLAALFNSPSFIHARENQEAANCDRIVCLSGNENCADRRSFTRRREPWSGLDVSLDVIDGLLHGRDLLGFLVGNFALEFLFQGHDQLARVERVRAQIVNERRVRRYLIFLDAKL